MISRTLSFKILISFLTIFAVSCTTTRSEQRKPVRKNVQKRPVDTVPQVTGEARRVTTPLTNSNRPPESTPTLNAPTKTRIDVLKDEYLKRPDNLEKYKTEIKSLSDSELEEVISSGEMGILRAHALFEKSQRLEAKTDMNGAINALEDVSRFAPGSTLADDAQKRITEFGTLGKVNSDTIAALLPLSGRTAAQGQKALRSLQMGLGITDQNSEFKLKVVDSEGTANGAESALHKAVFQDYPIAVVGPIISRTAAAVADECELYKIPCISLSQNAQVTENKNFVFTHSLNSAQIAKFLVQKAMQKGLKKFAILYPNDSYGVDYANAFWDEVLLQGGQVTAAQPYEPNETDFRFVAQRLVSSFYVESRREEYSMLSKEIKAAKKNTSTRENSSADDVLPPLVDFDAVFIPDSAKAMGQLSAFLSYVGVKKINIIGTNLWNVPGLAKRAQQFKDGVYFADMYNPADTNNQNIPFFKMYFEKFGEVPGPLEVHAYETGLMLRQALLRRIPNRQVMQSYLNNIKSFPGVFGQLNMNDSHQIERPLSFFKLDKEEITLANEPITQ